MQPPMRVTTTACKGIQTRTPESLRRLSQLQSSFSMQKFQERLKYEFTEENLSFEIEELFNTGEKVSKTFVACIVLACKYVTCSRRHSIARVNQMLQFQVFRDFQADIRRLRKQLEKKEATTEFLGDKTLVGLLADLRKIEAVLDEDGEVPWTI